MRGPTKNTTLPTLASPSNLVAVGRKLDRIHNYQANLPEEDNRQDAAATGALIWGNGFGSLRRSYKSPMTVSLEGPASALTATQVRLLVRVAFRQHFLEKLMTCSLRHCAVIS